MLWFFQSTSFSEQLWWTISLLEADSDLFTDRSYDASYYICKMVNSVSIKETLNWMVRGEGLWQKCSV